MFLEVEEGGQDPDEEAVKSLFNQIHSGSEESALLDTLKRSSSHFLKVHKFGERKFI